MVLARADGTSSRFYFMSRQIEKDASTIAHILSDSKKAALISQHGCLGFSGFCLNNWISCAGKIRYVNLLSETKTKPREDLCQDQYK